MRGADSSHGRHAGGRATGAAVLLLLVLGVQGLAFIGESSQTSDEAAHLLAGYANLTSANFRMHREEPPLIKELAALPLLALHLERPAIADPDRPHAYRLGRVFVHENRVPDDTILLVARLPILALSLILGWAIFRWGLELYGARPALLSLALYALDPNVVAHSGLVMTDLGVTLFMFLAVRSFWLWSRQPSPRALLVTGVFTGCALASKFTSFWLLPVFAVQGAGLILLQAPLPLRPWSARSPLATIGSPAARRIRALLLAAAAAGAVSLLVLAATYAGWGIPAYVAGLRRGMTHSTRGLTAYLMGQTSESGWWYYFLFAYLIKTPIGTLLIVGLAVAATLTGARRLRARDEIFLWAPILIIVAITCFWKVNLGLRHLLPIYPFLYLAAGRIGLTRESGAPRGWRAAILGATAAVCVACTGIEALAIAPYDLAYFNRFVGGPPNGHLYLLDSNLDWGQASKALRRFMTARNLPVVYCSYTGNSDPRYYGVRYQYVPGIGNFQEAGARSEDVADGGARQVLVVSAMSLHLIRSEGETLYGWLKDRKVVAMPGYAYLAYDITDDADAHARLAALYLDNRLPDRAVSEARRALRLSPGDARARAVLKAIGTVPKAAGDDPA